MLIKFSYFLAFTCALFLIGSCSSSPQNEQYEQLNAANAQLDSISQKLEANAFDSSNYWRQESSSIEIAIKRYYIPTQIDQAFARKMDRFKLLQGLVDTESELGGEPESEEEEEKEANIGVRIVFLRKAIVAERKQLVNLKLAMDAGELNKQEVTNALSLEAKNLRKLEEGLREYLYVRTKQLPVFIALCNELRIVADSLKQLQIKK
jgi:hypothetical protein